MRLVSVSGTRGSGKTTLIGRLIERLTAAGRRCAVIANESGKASYDDVTPVADGRVPVVYLRGG